MVANGYTQRSQLGLEESLQGKFGEVRVGISELGTMLWRIHKRLAHWLVGGHTSYARIR